MPSICPNYCCKCRKQKNVDWITKLENKLKQNSIKLFWWLDAPVNTLQTFSSPLNRTTSFCGWFFLFPFLSSLVLTSFMPNLNMLWFIKRLVIVYTIYIFTTVNDVSLSLPFFCLSTAQRPLSGLYLQAACSCWLASSCAQAEFSPTIPIMKIKSCGRGPNRYCRVHHTVKHIPTQECGNYHRGCKITRTQ